MQGIFMGTDDGHGRGLELQQPHPETDTKSVVSYSGPLAKRSSAMDSDSIGIPYSGPLSKRGSAVHRKGNGFSLSANDDDDDNRAYVEITLDVRDDSVAVHSVKPAGGADRDDPDVTLLARTLQNKSSFGSAVIRNASNRFRQVSQEILRLASFTKLNSSPLDRNKSAAQHALQGLKFITKASGAAGWPSVEKRFDELSSNGRLPRASFGPCIGMKESKEFAGELYDALARRRNITADSITKAELAEFWDQISDQSFDSRLQTFFDMVDKNADGRITENEVKEIISMSASANKLSQIQERSEEYARLIMEELDPNNIGYIEIYNLEMLLLQLPNDTRTRAANSRNLSIMLSQKLKPTLEPNPIRRWYQRGMYFVEDHWKRMWVVALWLSVCSGLFAWKFVQYRQRPVYHVMGNCVCVAKGAAETLKLNMALILLPVCRNTITWLRNRSRIGGVVPFDDNLNFHKLIACGIVVGVGLHAITHLTCDFPLLLHASDAKYALLMKPYFGDRRPDDYWWFVKGTEGWTGIVMVVLMAVAFTLATPWFRRGRLNLPRPFNRLTGFNAFWYSHHLFVVVYVLLIIHGTFLYLTKEWYKKTTWMYLAIPMMIYACERLTRALRSSIKPVKILKVAVYPGNVLSLHVSRPQGFKYMSGQYMFVNCSAVSPFQWHPFSITSAPQDDYLSVHIRTLGDWTKQLKQVFSEVCQPSSGGRSGLLRADEGGPNFPRVLIDGPYGAPAQDYKKYEVVLLVGLGIGATPFISVIKDILNNLRTLDDNLLPPGSSPISSGSSSSSSYSHGGGGEQEQSGSSSSSHSHPGKFKTRRAYFYWVTREQGSFEWFRGVMDEVANSDKKGAVELHNYCTSVYEEGDVRSALIAMLQSLNHAKNGVDVVSGTRVKTHFARPNWRNVYKRLALNHSDKRIGVFYCGAPALTKELRQLALDFSRKTTTKFDFHKENF